MLVVLSADIDNVVGIDCRNSLSGSEQPIIVVAMHIANNIPVIKLYLCTCIYKMRHGRLSDKIDERCRLQAAAIVGKNKNHDSRTKK